MASLSSLLTGGSIESQDLKFLELRKLHLTSAPIGNSVLNNIAVSDRHQLVFVAFANKLKGIAVSTLLNFEWSKTVLNQVIDSFPFAVEKDLEFEPTFLSISAGENKVLVVSGTAPDGVLTLKFYAICLNVNNALEPLGDLRLPSSRQGGAVVNLDWHPDSSDSLFAVSISDGSFLTVGVDVSKRLVHKLSHTVDQTRVSYVSWSPKGKQLVVGREDGQLTQYKHTNGAQLLAAKNIAAPNDLQGYRVVSLKWFLSSLFMVAYIDPNNGREPSTRYVLISSPPKCQPEYHDFGCICMDGSEYSGPSKYHISFNQIGNVILCSSTDSSEVSVVGCENSNWTSSSSSSTWKQWQLEDSSRIELPMTRDGCDSFPRGIAWFKSSNKVFNISETERYGGQRTPLLVILSSSGVICPYYVCYRNDQLNLPEAAQPVQLPLDNQRPPDQVIQVQPQPQPQATPTSFSPALVTANLPVTVPGSGFMSLSTPLSFQLQTHFEPKALPEVPASPLPVEASSVIGAKAAIERPQILEIQSDKVAEEQEEDAFKMALRDEVASFESHLQETKKRLSRVFSFNVTRPEELTKLAKETNELEKIMEASSDVLKGFSEDIDLLNGYLLENFARAEEMRSRMDRDTDPRYRSLLKKRALHPVAERKLKDIRELSQYIEVQMREANGMLDHEWEDYLSKRKGKMGSEKGSLELIYKTLANNQKVISNLQLQMKGIEAASGKYVRTHFLGTRNQSAGKASGKDIELLVTDLRRSQLRDGPDFELYPEETRRAVKVNTFPVEKRVRLRELLEQITSVPVRRAYLPNEVTSSRMISAMAKVKQKMTPAKKVPEKPIQPLYSPISDDAEVSLDYDAKSTQASLAPSVTTRAAPKNTVSNKSVQVQVSKSIPSKTINQLQTQTASGQKPISIPQPVPEVPTSVPEKILVKEIKKVQIPTQPLVTQRPLFAAETTSQSTFAFTSSSISTSTSASVVAKPPVESSKGMFTLRQSQCDPVLQETTTTRALQLPDPKQSSILSLQSLNVGTLTVEPTTKLPTEEGLQRQQVALKKVTVTVAATEPIPPSSQSITSTSMSLFGATKGLFSPQPEETRATPPVTSPPPNTDPTVQPITGQASIFGSTASQSPPQPSAVSKPFSLGSQSPFGTVQSSTPVSSQSLFGNTSTPTPSTGGLFSTPVAGTGQQKFGAFQPPVNSPGGGFGGAPAFGGKPTFGGTPPGFGSSPAFGGTPVFGGSSGFGSPPAAAFGSSPFGSPGLQPQSTFGSTSASPVSAFGGPTGLFGSGTVSEVATFSALASSSQVPTFGALAQQPSFGFAGQQTQLPQQQQQPQPFGSGAATGSSFSSASFTHRRQ